MRIYPDPELPDVVASWTEEDCRPGTGNVTLEMTGTDSGSTGELVVPCTDLTATFADVARERFHITGELRDGTGAVFSSSFADVDLRDGLSTRISMYFGAYSNFRVAWAFSGGATCTSLAVDEVEIDLAPPGEDTLFGFGALCDGSPYLGNVNDGTWIITARAFAGDQPVALSHGTYQVVVRTPDLADAGIVTLDPL